MTQEGPQEFWSIRTIEKATIMTALLLLMGALYFKPTVPFVGGIVAGAVIGFFNFRLIRRFVIKLLAGEQEQLYKKGFFFVLKAVLLMGAVGFLIMGAKVDAVAFVLGFSAIIVGIFYEGLRAAF